MEPRSAPPSLGNRPKRRLRIPAFTLVELIVVITILAILATVGFLSLSGFTDDARSATVAANVRTVYSAISTESTTSGNSPRYYVDHDPAAAVSGAIAFVEGNPVALTGGQWGQPPADSNYSAGNPRWDRLRMNGEKFKLAFVGRTGLRGDGFANEAAAAYDTGAVSVGAFDASGKATLTGKSKTVSYFQVVGVSPSTKKASVTGNYAAVGTGTVLGLVKDPSSGSSTGAVVDSATVSGAVVPADTVPPAGGSFTMASNTNSLTVTLSVTCPTDAAWSLPIQMAYGNSPAPTNWTACASSVSHSLTSGDGVKTVYVRFRDGVGNATADRTATTNYAALPSTFAALANKTAILTNLDTQLGGSSYSLCASTHDEATVKANCGYQNLIYLVRASGYDYGIYYQSLPSTFDTDSWIYNGVGFLFSSAWPNNVLQDNGTLQQFSYRQTNIMAYRGRSIGAWYSNSHLWCANGNWQNSFDLTGRPCTDYGTWNNGLSGTLYVFKKVP